MSDDGDKLGLYLGDFLTHADRIGRLAGLGRAAFDGDEFLRYAAEALLVRSGEIVARIDQAFPEFADQHPELELRELKATRNVIAHGYDVVDYMIVWEVVSVDIPRAADAVRAVLSAGGQGSGPVSPT
ncbi:MAG: DUF86 domain-containing protein [Bifidobacteriaceae bacterium]|nr:DUF86 domain-containing protein [Bifidobacteriaceae bacterium]